MKTSVGLKPNALVSSRPSNRAGKIQSDGDFHALDDLPGAILEIRKHARYRRLLHRHEKSLSLAIKAVERRHQDLAGSPSRGAIQSPSASGKENGGSHPHVDNQAWTAPPTNGGDGGSRSIVKSNEVMDPLARLSTVVLEQAQIPLREARQERERTMVKLAEQVVAAKPAVRAFVTETRGFGMLGLALILGEAGDLANYPNPAKLWKRMCLAVMPDGRCQRKVAKDTEEAKAQGYSPARRSIMWTIGDSLMKGNRGPYKKLYDERKVIEKAKLGVAEDETDLHAHCRAQRYMEKRLLLDLWKAWRLDQGDPDNREQAV